MSRMFSRKMSFFAKDLGVETTLMFAFDSQTDGLYRDKFPISWKVITMGSEGPYHATVTYHNQLAVLKPQVADDTVTGVDASKLIDIGEVTGLTKNMNGVYRLTANPSSIVQVKNDCPNAEDMALGFFGPNHTSESTPAPVLFLKDIGAHSSAQVQFTPVLRAYITDQYHENQILFGGVNTEALWEYNLPNLPEHTSWVLSRDQETGVFKITEH